MDAALGPAAPHLRIQIAAPFSFTTASSCSARHASTPRSVPPHREPAPGVPQIPPAGADPAPWHSCSHPALGAAPRSHPRRCGFRNNPEETPAAWEQGRIDGRGQGLALICTPRGALGHSLASGEQAQGHQAPDGTACPPWDARAASVPSPVPCRAGFFQACVTPCLSFPPPWIRCPLGALVFVRASVGLPRASPGLATRSPGIAGAPRRCNTPPVTATSTRSRGCCRP